MTLGERFRYFDAAGVTITQSLRVTTSVSATTVTEETETNHLTEVNPDVQSIDLATDCPII